MGRFFNPRHGRFGVAVRERGLFIVLPGIFIQCYPAWTPDAGDGRGVAFGGTNCFFLYAFAGLIHAVGKWVECFVCVRDRGYLFRRRNKSDFRGTHTSFNNGITAVCFIGAG